ncbi:MAG: biotin--[acetyl-CoA-carboxylase] ligase [Bacteroidetes bacterium]|jgi:BirA family biotin operon repressor/biotin-[acetyl-CoA-carboxylase] ligase|nr:biotin--[acetyl-CoA-carboxylase] ligase [Bacteroidota bacterium]
MKKIETHFFPVIDSTNKYLSDLMNSGKEIDGLCVRSAFQETGKGLGQHTWHSEAGKNLLFSVGFNFSFLHASQQFLISQMASLAVFQVLQQYVEKEKLRVKWPNDIYFENRKLGGMLISNTINGMQLERSIIGLGINVNQTDFPDSIPRPVSLKQLLNKDLDLEILLEKLLMNYLSFAEQLKDDANKQKIASQYLSILYRYDQVGWYAVDGKKMKLRITGIGEFGFLQTEDGLGNRYEFDMKEIEFLF